MNLLKYFNVDSVFTLLKELMSDFFQATLLVEKGKFQSGNVLQFLPQKRWFWDRKLALVSSWSQTKMFSKQKQLSLARFMQH